jgi:hypothetical protein
MSKQSATWLQEALEILRLVIIMLGLLSGMLLLLAQGLIYSLDDPAALAEAQACSPLAVICFATAVTLILNELVGGIGASRRRRRG